jgi:hypothetical protein
VGTLSIASPTASYKAAITHGENGWLAASHEWLSVLRTALSQRDRYRAMAERAHAHARTRYAWTSQREVILQALGLSA